MANIQSGSSVSASGFNNLFTRLDNIRKNHLNKDGQNSTANSTFATAFNTSVAKVGEKPIPNNVQQIKNNLTTLAQSAWLDTTFASKITIPTVGSLLKATDFNVADNTITEVEGICPNYSQYSQYGQYGNYDQYGQYTNYGQYGQYTNYAKYSQYDDYGNFSRYGQYGEYDNYGNYANYGNYGQYGNYGNYGKYGASSCFLEGTEILLADGTIKLIENIISGDELLVYNEQTHQHCKAIAISRKPYFTNKIISIVLSNGNIIKATPNHPILSTKGWCCLELESAKKEHNVDPIPLEITMQIITKDGISEVVDIIEHIGSFKVYNIEVPEFHTYFANGTVTHNIASK